MRAVWAEVAAASAMCRNPDVPGGNPVTLLPGATPSSPVIQLGPAFVIVVPARTAKVPAIPSPGSVAASAVAGQARNMRATTLNDKADRRIFHPFLVLMWTRRALTQAEILLLSCADVHASATAGFGSIAWRLSRRGG